MKKFSYLYELMEFQNLKSLGNIHYNNYFIGNNNVLHRFKNGEVVIPDLRISIHTNEEGQIKSTLTIDHFSGLDIANVR